MSSETTSPPAVSIILPTYNRGRFLPQAIESIRDQQWTDWELIIVDDGSTDETAELLPKLTAEIAQPVQIIRQENQGAYAARNTGLDHADGKYIAFFDSDDIWLPHHLRDCVEALQAHPEVGWVFAATRMLDLQSGRTLKDNAFYFHGQAIHFMRLHSRRDGNLHVIDDPAARRVIIRYGMMCGLQNSVIRRNVFTDRRFAVRAHHETEDQIFLIRAIVDGITFAYFNNVHVLYYVHDGNSSATTHSAPVHKRLAINLSYAEGLEQIRNELPLLRCELRQLNRRLSDVYFWQVGYNVYAAQSMWNDAMRMFLLGIRLQPLNLKFLKTFAVTCVRALISRRKSGLLAEP